MAIGAGAKASWHAQSQKVFEDMRRLFAPYQVEKVDFEVGETARACILASYERCKNDSAIVKKQFSSVVKMQDMAALEIERRLDDNLYVFIQDSESKGVYRSSAKAISQRLSDLLKYDGNTVFVAGAAGTAGVLVDYEEDSVQTPYELEAWG
jgi:hypothetical protein